MPETTVPARPAPPPLVFVTPDCTICWRQTELVDGRTWTGQQETGRAADGGAS